MRQKFLGYESITRSKKGEPNVFSSRKGVPGENAIHGGGFYTKVGRSGARDTGFTIRFKLNPDARLGHDFDYVPKEDFVIIKNKRALRVLLFL